MKQHFFAAFLWNARSFVFLVGLSIAILLGGAAAQAACLSQSEARAAVANGQARSLGSLAGSVGGEIVRADLCKEGGRFVYRLSVVIGGKVVQRVLDASSGQVLQ